MSLVVSCLTQLLVAKQDGAKIAGIELASVNELASEAGLKCIMFPLDPCGAGLNTCILKRLNCSLVAGIVRTVGDIVIPPVDELALCAGQRLLGLSEKYVITFYHNISILRLRSKFNQEYMPKSWPVGHSRHEAVRCLQTVLTLETQLFGLRRPWWESWRYRSTLGQETATEPLEAGASIHLDQDFALLPVALEELLAQDLVKAGLGVELIEVSDARCGHPVAGVCIHPKADHHLLVAHKPEGRVVVGDRHGIRALDKENRRQYRTGVSQPRG